MTRFPLIGHATADAVVAWRGGRPVTAGAFLAAVTALAERLPTGGHVLNLRTDRLGFAVGFGAALTRGAISLLPPNDTPEMLRRLGDAYLSLVHLTDSDGLDMVSHRPANVTAFEIPTFPADQVAAIAFTSGSTGEPMPQAKTWGTLARSVRGAGTAMGIPVLGAAGLVGTVPHQHMYGLESVILLALQHGLALHARRPFYPEDISSALGELGSPRILVTTPVHLRTLLADGVRLPKLDFILCATAPLAPQLAIDAEIRLEAPLHEIYGCSETGQLAVRRTRATAEWSCIDGVRLRSDDQGTWASGDFLKGETLLADVIELNGPERFILHGRAADQVNIAGKRSSLAYLNHHLNSIEGVVDGVFVMPDEDTGQGARRLAAFAVAPGLTVETLMHRLRQRIDPAFLPRPLRLVEALPRNATGKLTRDALTRLFNDPRPGK
ncbi:beta-hydroxyacyl-ACP dehydratase [Skermanella stibiiresistens SB22]|uniref:Long-chain-fatty-acid--CoA ligase n=1 Tax=Skermanella stibiiresistens SB22 TaxID=1385369 RepID=W9HB34_9PROT|nr:AMP-binding protein [Skermanella stibiiresistens]EWY41922.1 beta-hydroxyacyl-ACP dehydratase [Skermanella stibiiresistens SB22]